ncbi:uncharacterized protein MONOS_11511 [Monocercomonoides exilis]|uniref:uncharacterized protein n=1 Tax=Monocercomonoides exilis TaxID=2049356 RepID=UPI00355AA6C7|nr:hypothetical protein MONOS_11511 [Monocercomonoides exilis]|eukprot:MONOS_11511.1-p1 / transcript=MONOS_11511.1 / gene=MONOS_11511 / organism=Monocercomonoides_exilis_PA203 / gene_product=unspecified product / transcript_product=unspecified product / location=Mono_scaffold00582:8527-9169(+) / protein_length=133 / sequence_SO=supercontig / SO=protein_coding / is_pseudo=false
MLDTIAIGQKVVRKRLWDMWKWAIQNVLKGERRKRESWNWQHINQKQRSEKGKTEPKEGADDSKEELDTKNDRPWKSAAGRANEGVRMGEGGREIQMRQEKQKKKQREATIAANQKHQEIEERYVQRRLDLK